MSLSSDEAMQDANELRHGYPQEVVCDTCRDALVVRFWEGEPISPDELDCPCGGRLRVE
jgi:hypothetical protein